MARAKFRPQINRAALVEAISAVAIASARRPKLSYTFRVAAAVEAMPSTLRKHPAKAAVR